MQKRPLSMTIIGWFLVVSVGFSLFGLTSLSSNPMALRIIEQSGMSLGVHMAWSLLGVVVTLVSGYGILKGRDWGRMLYVVYSIFSMLVGLVISPYPSLMILGLVFFAVIAFFLFRPAANAWFGKSYFGAGSGDASAP